MSAPMTTEQAVLALRGSPANAELLRDSYLDADVQAAALRFAASPEFAEAVELVGGVRGKSVLDLGAGTGIASWAFAGAGARRVVALEPDPSDVVGQGAIRSLGRREVIEQVGAYGERLPFQDGEFDVVYARQVLHHARDLRALVSECARVPRPGGSLLACREHVVDDPRAAFVVGLADVLEAPKTQRPAADAAEGPVQSLVLIRVSAAKPVFDILMSKLDGRETNISNARPKPDDDEERKSGTCEGDDDLHAMSLPRARALELLNALDVGHRAIPRIGGRDTQHLGVGSGFVLHPEHRDGTGPDVAAGKRRLVGHHQDVERIAVVSHRTGCSGSSNNLHSISMSSGASRTTAATNIASAHPGRSRSARGVELCGVAC